MRVLLLSLLDFNRRCCCKNGHLFNELLELDTRYELLVCESQVLDEVLLHHAHSDYIAEVLSQVLLRRRIVLLFLLEYSLQNLLKI